jgi:hypothetical protein
MKVHGQAVKNSNKEKYLGDIISSTGSNKPNLANRLSRGWGRVNEILGLVSEAPLGRWKIKSGLLLRKSLLINAILFNSEAWHNFSYNQIEAFEKIDESLLRGLVLGHSKLPVPALYLETGQVPIRYIMAVRRILYLQTILQRGPSELIKQVYLAQKEDPNTGDFCKLVDQDRLLIDCQLSDDQIESVSKYDLKVLVKRMAKQAAFKRLIAIKETKTKMDNLSYLDSFSPQPYLDILTRKQSSLLMALRTRTVRGIRTDFGDLFPSKQCPLPGCLEPDSLSHTLVCQVLVGADSQHSLVQYGDVFSSSVAVQQQAVARFEVLLEIRERLLEKQ